MTIRRFSCAALLALLTSCRPDVRNVRSDAAEIHTRLEAKRAAIRPADPYESLGEDSARSAVVPRLSYHWMLLTGRRTHDLRFVTVAHADGRMFDPENPAAWAPLFASWQPQGRTDAIAFCAEAVAAGIAERPSRLGDRRLLILDSVAPTLGPYLQGLVSRALNSSEVVPPSREVPAWDVQLWSLDGSTPYRGRLASRYRCRIPTGPSPLVIEIVDSIDHGDVTVDP